MSTENKTDGRELALYALAIVCAACVLLSPVACTVSRQHTIAAAVKAGADPIAAKCAIEGDNGNTAMCLAYAMKPAR